MIFVDFLNQPYYCRHKLKLAMKSLCTLLIFSRNFISSGWEEITDWLLYRETWLLGKKLLLVSVGLCGKINYCAHPASPLWKRNVWHHVIFGRIYAVTEIFDASNNVYTKISPIIFKAIWQQQELQDCATLADESCIWSQIKWGGILPLTGTNRIKYTVVMQIISF